MTKTTAAAEGPRVEILLVSAHRDHAVLCERRGALMRSGITSDHLPGETALMAFALLGEHERDKLLAQVRAHWSVLQAKGLVHGVIDVISTAELRLLAHASLHTEAIANVWQQLRVADPLEPPPGILRCATRVLGLWGQLARLHFSLRDVRYLLIEPEPIFGLQPALLAIDPDDHHIGSFDFPIDNGAIRISLLHRNGEVFRHVVEAMVEEIA